MLRQHHATSTVLAASILALASGPAAAQFDDLPEPPVTDGIGTDVPEVPDPTQPMQPSDTITPGGGGASADLSVSLNGPSCAIVGQAIGNLIDVDVTNSSNSAVNTQFSVGVYLAPEPVIMTTSTLLKGGREHVQSVAAQTTVDVKTAPIAIPHTVSPGRFHLGAIVDEFDAVSEADEDNNVYHVPIRIASEAQGCP